MSAFERVCRLTDEAMKRHAVPGAAVGVLHEDRTEVAGFGVTSVDSDPTMRSVGTRSASKGGGGVAISLWSVIAAGREKGRRSRPSDPSTSCSDQRSQCSGGAYGAKPDAMRAAIASSTEPYDVSASSDSAPAVDRAASR